MQYHIVSFEGPDAYSRAGGLATRVEGLAETLGSLGFETHLWFVGDPNLPGHETRGNLHLHRWAQWVSRYHPGGVYDNESGKQLEFAASLPPYLMREVFLPYVRKRGRAVILAEEWHTADAVLHLDWLLEREGVRDRAAILWNANNLFGFDRIDWDRLARAATITTVSRYMKQRMWDQGVDPLVIPNGLPADAFDPPDRLGCAELRRRFRDRTVLTKMARWDPDKRWIGAIELVAEMKREGWRPLLIARGGAEPHGEEVLAAARARGLHRIDRDWIEPGTKGLLGALRNVDGADVVNLRSHVDPKGRRMLFRASAVVLANSVHEPFGLVGLETMAAGGIACTGCSGEDYAVPGQNALVLETGNPREFLGMFHRLRTHPHEESALRRAGRWTAKRFVWSEIVQRVLVPRLELVYSVDSSRRAAGSLAPNGVSPVSLAKRVRLLAATRPSRDQIAWTPESLSAHA